MISFRLKYQAKTSFVLRLSPGMSTMLAAPVPAQSLPISTKKLAKEGTIVLSALFQVMFLEHRKRVQEG